MNIKADNKHVSADSPQLNKYHCYVGILCDQTRLDHEH